MAESETRRSVVISEEHGRRLDALCGMDRRPLKHEIELLIDEELERREIDPETLEPKQSARRK